MEKIRVNKTDLLRRMAANREQHREVYLEAVEEYRKRVLELLEERISVLRKGRVPEELSVYLPIPEDHTKDYDRVIDMLEMDQGEFIEITEREFGRYARDEWEWSQAWFANTQSYTTNV